MTTQYIPVHLWDGLQEMLYEHDYRFLQDASRITGIPQKELSAKITGTRGVIAVIPEAAGPWWMGTACPVMSRAGYLWRRCVAPAEANGYCMEHHKGGVHYDDEQFKDIATRVPFRYEGELYWVSEDSDLVFDAYGMPVHRFAVDLKTRTVILHNDAS